ncbi:unnamed protein product [Wuchereria bancrofti]|nr:unnamed protein product [Wuchereria bancrofti]
MKSVVSLSNQLGQVNLQQYERKECQQGGNVAAATNKQFP